MYLTNVEQICRRFVEERRAKLGKLLEDKARWSRYCMHVSDFVVFHFFSGNILFKLPKLSSI